MASAAGTPPSRTTSEGRARRSPPQQRPAAAPAPTALPADPMASVPHLRGTLHLPSTERLRREWATSPQRYSIRVGWRRARVSDNVADLLQLIDGSRTLAQLAAELGTLQGRVVHPAEVLYLIQRRLIPAGLVALKANARPAGHAVAGPARAARPSQTPAPSRPSQDAAAVPAAAILEPRAAELTRAALLVAPDAPRQTTPLAATSHATEPPSGRPTLLTAPLAAQLASAPPLPADMAVTQPLPEPLEVALLSPTFASAPSAPLPAPAPLAPLVDEPPTLPAILWHELGAPDTRITPVVTPAPEPATPQRALVPAVAAGRPAVAPQRGGAPTRTQNSPTARRPRTAAAGRVAVGIVGLAFLLGGLVAVLSLNGQWPSLGAFQQVSTAQPTHAPTATLPRERLAQGERAYAVQPGDTLASIAGQHGVSADALLIVNGDVLPQTSALQAGMQLAIPAVYNPQLAPAVQPRPLYYVVKSGDTLYDIGLFFGTSWTAIADYNHLADPRTLTVGQGLLIPPAGP